MIDEMLENWWETVVVCNFGGIEGVVLVDNVDGSGTDVSWM